MSQTDFINFDSWAFRWDSTQLLWFILVEKDRFSHLHFREVEKDAGEWKFQSMPMAEKKSRVMGAASYKSCFNITDVISAPSTKCILAADSFIKGNIKLLQTCAQRSGNSEVDPYVDLDCRISAALESFKEKYSGSEEKMVVVFVDKRLESVLRHVANLSNMAYELYVPACSKNLLPCAGVHSTEQACRSLISKLLTRWRFVGILHNCFGKNEDREWKSQSMTTIEARSGLMGEASHEARFNITDVICAPSIKCIIAADSFIK
ncbi:hypothetical protein T4B_7856, partial [Trichinella pseudospiralis]